MLLLLLLMLLLLMVVMLGRHVGTGTCSHRGVQQGISGTPASAQVLRIRVSLLTRVGWLNWEGRRGR